MGTTTFYLRHNDIGRKLSSMTKGELDRLDNLSPYKSENHAFGWSAPLELHNGNIYPLIFWRGKIIRLDEAPYQLNEKYYSRLMGKNMREYEWTMLRKFLLNELNKLDKDFKKSLRKKQKKKY